LDNDFGTLVFAHGRSHSGLLRLVDFRTSDHAEALVDALRRYGAALDAGAVVVLEPDRTRIRE
jgi:predicted nuclease of predicted toxin-antitoxin system